VGLNIFNYVAPEDTHWHTANRVQIPKLLSETAWVWIDRAHPDLDVTPVTSFLNGNEVFPTHPGISR
jgi:hypothetical protein